MEKTAVTFVNEVSKSPFGGTASRGHLPGAMAEQADADFARAVTTKQLSELLHELVRPIVREHLDNEGARIRRSPAEGSDAGERSGRRDVVSVSASDDSPAST
jgi:hypothetical protein